jgi:hypothetical protein
MPNFINSPFFVPEPDNWHLKEGAPEEVKKEFEEFMRETDMDEASEPEDKESRKGSTD